MTLAHQYLFQLTPEVREAVLGNAGTIIAFRVGARDAAYLAQEFQPTFDQEDFINLPNHNAYLRLMIDGVMSSPFSAGHVHPSQKCDALLSPRIANHA